MSDVTVTLAELHVHPVKSCGGVMPLEATLCATGLADDRQWMVVDATGRFVSQREHAQMARVRPQRVGTQWQLSAPSAPGLTLHDEAAGAPCRVRVWDDEVAAFDQGDAAAAWFSQQLGQAVRLVRFDPAQQRLSSASWSAGVAAENAFSDGFPLLVASTASLAELNARLARAGHASVGMNRFRPNLVLDGLDAHGEDFLDEVRFATPGGEVRIKLTKPCARCPIPDVDPATAERGHAVGDTLASYRADARLGGALTFGMNALIVRGQGLTLRVGQVGEATFRFD
ncbi:MAG: hypothetical protein RJA98_1787 [Pseudomonadota bacterium]|jgi:uncharacterized protein YcbX